MAELVFSSVGQALGGAFGAIGATLGQVGGAVLGAAIDRQIFGTSTERVGPRLTDLHIQGSTEGASIPAVYGSVRVAGQVIWAAHFKERVETDEVDAGGKGGPSVTTRTYHYSLSFAVGLCEGEIARIGRIWANGAPMDVADVVYRVHTGGESQDPDPIIEAIEGAENEPAYRGLAYVVFEDLPLDAFGNAIPHLSFEIIRAAPAASDEPRLEERVTGVCLIPGAGEFVYATNRLLRRTGPGEATPENVHAMRKRANLLVSLDQLAVDLPSVETVMLVVSWFGDDLRCGECKIRPGVEAPTKHTLPQTWRAGDTPRDQAHLISAHAGGPAYGGTPSDESIVQAITELKARGYKVGLYPFLLMDVPADNVLPDPYGGETQAAYPWRGRISVYPAAGEMGSPDQTSAATDQVTAFFGNVAAADFSEGGDDLPHYDGPDEWSYRRFILHYAKLAAMAGGVDVFLVGSELRGLTSARDSATTFPAVAALRALASDVRGIVGAETTITYAADWSEYFGCQPQDGSGDVLFHLDPLWADDAIDVIGIDWYAPLTDWRDGDAHLDAQLAHAIHDPDYLRGRIEAGENHEWYYASPADRTAQVRTPITDGEGEPWIFRPKDVRAFWSQAHHNRPGGVRSPSPTAWIPESKPIWFVELGCPAIDRGANQPSVFLDPKSSESAAPHFSSSARDDLIQRRTLEAYLRHWGPDSDYNPVSSLTGRPMIEQIMLWCWDARPFPAFPARTDVWADGAAWRTGHWLNGRAGLSTLSDVVASLCARAQVFDPDVAALSGIVGGYVVDAPSSARDALEPLMAAYDFTAAEREGRLVFFHRNQAPPTHLGAEHLDARSIAEPYAWREAGDAPVEARVRFLDAARDYLVAGVSARRLDRAEGGVATLEAALVLDADAAEALAQRVLSDRRAATETLHIGVGPQSIALEPGDGIVFAGSTDAFEVSRIEDAHARQLELHRVRRDGVFVLSAGDPSTPPLPATAPTPLISVLDLPPLPGAEDETRPLAAMFASPWLGAHGVFGGASVSLRGACASPAIAGELLWALWPGPIDRWDEGNRIRVKLYGGALASASRDAILNGANVFAIENEGEWEVIQAANCELVGESEYELSDFLRGRLGSAHAMASPHAVGARIIKLDARLKRFDVAAHEWGEPLALRAPPFGDLPSSERAAALSVTLAKAALRPWAPAHLRAYRGASGDVEISWIRCARIGGDAWGPGEPPLGAPAEGYRVGILDAGTLVRAVNASVPRFVYSVADQSADFGAPPSSLHIRVAQIGESGATGLNSELTITL